MLRLIYYHIGFVNDHCIAQYTWKLEKEKNGIRCVFSGCARSRFPKAIKVECVLTGTYSKITRHSFPMYQNFSNDYTAPKSSRLPKKQNTVA